EKAPENGGSPGPAEHTDMLLNMLLRSLFPLDYSLTGTEQTGSGAGLTRRGRTCLTGSVMRLTGGIVRLTRGAGGGVTGGGSRSATLTCRECRTGPGNGDYRRC